MYSLCVSSGLPSGHDRVGGQAEDKCPHHHCMYICCNPQFYLDSIFIVQAYTVYEAKENFINSLTK